MQQEKLSYRETARQFEINNDKRVAAWERIYLTEGPEGLAIERRGHGSKGCPPKQLPKETEEDLLAEVQCLRAENDYLKTCKPWLWKTSDAGTKAPVVQKLRQKHAPSILLSIAQLPCATFYYHLKQIHEEISLLQGRNGQNRTKLAEAGFPCRKAEPEMGHRCDGIQLVWGETVSVPDSRSAQQRSGQLYHIGSSCTQHGNHHTGRGVCKDSG